MHLGWRFRRIAAAAVLTLGLGLAAGDGTALGLELPSAEAALGAETTLPAVPELPPTSVLPIDPGQIGPTVPPTPISPPPGPIGPSEPSGPPVSPSGSATSAQASVNRTRRGNLQSTGRSVRNIVNGDRSSAPSASLAGANRTRRAGGARTGDRPRRRGLSRSSPGFQIFHPSSLARLGRILGDEAPPPRFLGGFSASATGGAGWAPPLLTILFLIGLGGFLRTALPAPRRQQ